jgi:hypothetical protein
MKSRTEEQRGKRPAYILLGPNKCKWGSVRKKVQIWKHNGWVTGGTSLMTKTYDISGEWETEWLSTNNERFGTVNKRKRKENEMNNEYSTTWHSQSPRNHAPSFYPLLSLAGLKGSHLQQPTTGHLVFISGMNIKALNGTEEICFVLWKVESRRWYLPLWKEPSAHQALIHHPEAYKSIGPVSTGRARY